MVKVMGFGVRAELNPCSATVWLWPGDLTSLSLSFFVCRMEVITAYTGLDFGKKTQNDGRHIGNDSVSDGHGHYYICLSGESRDRSIREQHSSPFPFILAGLAWYAGSLLWKDPRARVRGWGE